MALTACCNGLDLVDAVFKSAVKASSDAFEASLNEPESRLLFASIGRAAEKL